MYSFFSLYFIKENENFREKSDLINKKLITDNHHILNMYYHHLDGHMKAYDPFIDLEEVTPLVKFILDKGLLTAEVVNELPINENSSTKKSKI
jgi:hypothetical protein